MSDRRSVTQAVITAQAALAAVGAAVRHAEKLGVKVNVAVTDPSGLLAGFARMPGAPLHSIDIAIDKAYTAAGFGLPTSQWHDVLREHHSEPVRDGLLRRPRLVAFGGGLPIMDGDERIGGIGVSGGSEAQDAEIAQAGLDALP